MQIYAYRYGYRYSIDTYRYMQFASGLYKDNQAIHMVIHGVNQAIH